MCGLEVVRVLLTRATSLFGANIIVCLFGYCECVFATLQRVFDCCQ
jgi:hypothetical protein